MASDMETAFRQFLLDPGFWRPKLERMARVPRELALFPRPDLGRPGIEVLELRLRAHDGTRLRALLATCAFAGTAPEVHVVSSEFLGPTAVDWDCVEEEGASALVYERPVQRHLQDRVLDTLRLVAAASELPALDGARIAFGAPGATDLPDELLLAKKIQDLGWMDGN